MAKKTIRTRKTEPGPRPEPKAPTPKPRPAPEKEKTPQTQQALFPAAANLSVVSLEEEMKRSYLDYAM